MRKFVILCALIYFPSKLFAQFTFPYSCFYNNASTCQSIGGKELILKHRPDISDTTYELFVHFNMVNMYGYIATNGIFKYLYWPRGSYYLTDTCNGKFQRVQWHILHWPLPSPPIYPIPATYWQTNPYNGDSTAKRIHEVCGFLPEPQWFPDTAHVDSMVYMKDFWLSRIFDIPYKCGKTQIGFTVFDSYGFTDSSTNIEYPSIITQNPFPQWNPMSGSWLPKPLFYSSSHLIQINTLLPNSMPGYASNLDFYARAWHWTSIPVNAIDAEGDSLVFTPSYGMTFENAVEYRGPDLSNYGDILPYLIAAPSTNPNVTDTQAVAVDTAYVKLKCIPGQSGPGCTRYNPINNPFDCDSTFSMNPNTGEIKFFTKTPGQHVDITQKVDEYRNGTWLSTSYRVLRIHTIDSGYVSNPKLTLDTALVQGCAIDTNLTFTACAGSQIVIPYKVVEAQNLGSLFLSDNTALPTVPGAMSYSNQMTDSVHGIFTWNSLPTDSGWYYISLNIKDSACSVSEFIQNTAKIFRIYISKNGLEVLPSDTTLCFGQNINLSATGAGNNIQWNVLSGAASFSCQNCKNVNVTPSQTSVIQATSQLTGACKAKDTVVIKVIPNYTITASDILVCGIKTEVNINASSSYDTSYLQATWQPISSILGNNNQFSIKVNPNLDTQFVITVTDTLGCFTKSDTATITYDENFNPFFTTDKLDICVGDTVNISVLGTGIGSISWTPNYNISDTSTATVIAWPDTTTIYTAQIQSNVSTCKTSISTAIEVTRLRADAGRDTTIYDGSNVWLGGENLLCDDDCNVRWIPNTFLFLPNMPAPLCKPPYDMRYVQILTSDKGGCTDRDTVDIKVLCTDIYMPNAFSPGSDRGERSVQGFGPNNYGLDIKVFRVFNRYGEMVFYADDLQSRWDGTYKGVKQPTGVYVYYIQAKCPNSNKLIEKQGNVTLIR